MPPCPRLVAILQNVVRRSRELAHRAGIHRTYVGDIERGGRNPGLVNICRIAQALEVEPSEIFIEMGM